jgi:hypothetical protein
MDIGVGVGEWRGCNYYVYIIMNILL